jgi:multimeric flavodoxin WrbA
MKIVLLNGSPKKLNSEKPLEICVSQTLLDILEQRFSGNNEITKLRALNASATEFADNITISDALVIASPLYSDALPSHLLRLLDEAAGILAEKALNIPVYIIINCGYFESEHNKNSLEIFKAFCRRAGLFYARGLAIGGGGMIGEMPIESFVWKRVSAALDELVQDIELRRSGEDIYRTPRFPRFLYTILANLGWHKIGRKNGVAASELYKSV